MLRCAIVALIMLSTGASAAARSPRLPSHPSPAVPRDVRESVCLMIEAAARSHDLPLRFFARVIWQESRFRPDVVDRARAARERAQGIAQFMPGTAAERGLLDPFDPVQALPKSAEFLREAAPSVRQSGTGGGRLPPGPQRVRGGWRENAPCPTRPAATSSPSPALRSTWANSGEREPEQPVKSDCRTSWPCCTGRPTGCRQARGARDTDCR